MIIWILFIGANHFIHVGCFTIFYVSVHLVNQKKNITRQQDRFHNNRDVIYVQSERQFVQFGNLVGSQFIDSFI